MTDEVGSMVLSTGGKAVEIGAELIRLLAPLAKDFLSALKKQSVDDINSIIGAITTPSAKGTITNKALFAEAQKAECGISTTSNILSADVQAFVTKAKQYEIPVAVVGNSEKQTIEFLDRDKGIIEQITNEVLQERLKEAPQSVKCFNISENNVTAMKAVMEENGIDCQFTKTADGKVKCVYPAEMAEQVAVVKADYKQLHSEVSENLTIQKSENEITISDEKSGKSFSFSNENKAQTMDMLREQFGYSEAKADLAANKICRDLGLDKEKSLADTRQYDNLNSFKTNIRYQSDDITLRDMRFNSVNFKDGNVTHIVISNGDKTAALTPEKMTDTEMKNICVNQLGMSPQQAEKAVEKSKKIDRQVKSKIEERTVGKDGISHSIGIERTSQNGFTLTLGSKSKTYNFSTINVADKIARDFNVPKQTAQNVIDKAQKQSLLQNKIKNTANKQPSANAPKPKLTGGKGLKR